MTRHTSDDLFHEKPADADHIRLISEGGRSTRDNPPAVCIDSIHVAHNCTSESQHKMYRAANDSFNKFSSSNSSLFSLSSEHALELDRGGIPEALRSRFEQQRIPLSDAALIKVQKFDSSWVISDQGARYTIKKLASNLVVYKSPPP